MSIERQALEAAHRRSAQKSREERRARGVVHTPSELSAWALSRVEQALVDELGTSGLSDPRVCVLDPAVGTGVWLAAALARVRASARSTWCGFDVDASALETAREILSPAAATASVELALREANTLEVEHPWPGGAHVRVIVGNPPWATRSLSRGMALSDAWLEDFKRDASGAPLGERRVGVLSDDYIRFFRWALEQVRTAEHGAIVCLATNSSYLDGPVHRGMRARLRDEFDRIELLDLGGNALLARAAHRDENIFGVRVGACVALLIRRPGRGPRRALVAYRRVRGSAADKLARLASDDLGPVMTLAPEPPFQRFVPGPARATALEDSFSVAEAFPFHREGVQTNRDAIATAHDRDELCARLTAIARGDVALDASRHFDPVSARAVLARALEEHPETCVTELAYRPLERRYMCTVAPLCHRPRPELAAATSRSELCLLAARKDRGSLPFSLFGVARGLSDACFLSTRSSCRTRVFPSHTPDGRENLAPRVTERIGRVLGRAPRAREVIEYTLALLASASYRARMGDALKHDYPRVPFPRDEEMFVLARSGERLVAALCGGPCDSSALSVCGDIDESSEIPSELIRLDAAAGRVWLGRSAFIGGLPHAAFTALVGHELLLARRFTNKRVWRVSSVLEIAARATLWAHEGACADVAYLRCAAG